MALFMYPHSITATLSSNSRNTIRRNAAILPAYSLRAGAAGAARLGGDRGRHQADRRSTASPTRSWSIPQLFEDCFPSWFAGVAFAAVAIGALVPAAIMSIAAANPSPATSTASGSSRMPPPPRRPRSPSSSSLVVKFVALVFVLTMDKQNAINFQLLGGIWILQTFPAIVFGLYTRWFHRWALLAGWAVGMVYGTDRRLPRGQPGDQALRRLARHVPALDAARLHRA